MQNTMLLHTQVNNMRLKEGSSVRDLRDMKEMYDRLAMLDNKVNEKDQVINLLASLPPSYNALKSVLLARGPGITWTDVQQVLTLEEQQRQLQLTKTSSNVDRDSKEKVIQGAMRVEPVFLSVTSQDTLKETVPSYNEVEEDEIAVIVVVVEAEITGVADVAEAGCTEHREPSHRTILMKMLYSWRKLQKNLFLQKNPNGTAG